MFAWGIDVALYFLSLLVVSQLFVVGFDLLVDDLGGWFYSLGFDLLRWVSSCFDLDFDNVLDVVLFCDCVMYSSTIVACCYFVFQILIVCWFLLIVFGGLVVASMVAFVGF